MAIPTIQEVVDMGKVSIYLSGNDNARGNLFSPRLASPGSNVSIAMITDALLWGYEGGAQSAQALRQVANYIVWLIGAYGQTAQYILQGTGGGTVIPGGGGIASSVYPIFITSANFETDGVSYDNSQILGDNLIIYINQYNQYWLPASGTTFQYTPTGIKILIPLFDANTDEYEITIMKFN